MDSELINRLVLQVVGRIARKLGADGSRQNLLVVFTGCSGDVAGAVDIVKKLLMKGYRLPLFFSSTAGNSYRESVEKQLEGLPFIQTVNTGQWSQWTDELGCADGVLVPLVSVNTLSRLSLLMADAPHTHLLLNAITEGKPVVLVSNTSTVSASPSRHLKEAMQQRLSTVEQYGAAVCESSQVISRFETYFPTSSNQTAQNSLPELASAPPSESTTPLYSQDPLTKPTRRLSGRVLTATAVTQAARGGYDLECEQGVIITPMAKDLVRLNRVIVYQR